MNGMQGDCIKQKLKDVYKLKDWFS